MDGPCAGGGTGAAFLQCLLEHGFGCCLTLNQNLPVQTGVSTASVQQAIDGLFSLDPVSTEYPPTVTDAYSTYTGAGGNGSRVPVLPLVQFAISPEATYLAGVRGFTAFFLKRRFSTGQKAFYGEFLPLAPTPTTPSSWGRIKDLYR